MHHWPNFLIKFSFEGKLKLKSIVNDIHKEHLLDKVEVRDVESIKKTYVYIYIYILSINVPIIKLKFRPPPFLSSNFVPQNQRKYQPRIKNF